MNALAILPKSITATCAGKWLTAQCSQAGVTLTHTAALSGQDYVRAFTSHQHVITWNCAMPHTWLTQNHRNVLFVENSLISQKAGMFIDSRGYFTNSALHMDQHWNDPGTFDLDFIAHRDFGWRPHTGGTPDGPILIALQTARDCNLRTNYPAHTTDQNPNHLTLALARQHLPSTIPVVVRPHPREPDIDTTYWPDHWTLSTQGKFHEILPTARALVTVNSTCASEAALLGMPIATLGVGAFTGAGVTLECANHPDRLAYLPVYKPDLQAQRNYVTAILARHFLPYDTKPDRLVPEFQKWLSKIPKQS